MIIMKRALMNIEILNIYESTDRKKDISFGEKPCSTNANNENSP